MDKALSAEEVLKIAGIPIKLIKYSDLSLYKTICDIFGTFKAVLLLYEQRINSGHWVCLINHKDTIHFFDSYGLFPDDELRFSNIKFRKENDMFLPYLTYLLYHSPKTIDFNDIKLQKIDEKIATCGRWCGMRMRMHKLTNDEFSDLFKNIKKNERDPLIVNLTEKYIV